MLTRAIDGYLAVRRAAGFALTVDGGLLRSFAQFAADRAESHVQRQTAIAWAAQAPSPSQRERRLGMVRRFVAHARAEDPGHERVPRHVFARRRTRPLPYLFSDRELAQLLAATARLRPRGSLRPLTYATLFGLLAATGLRISEALHLVLDDLTADGLLVRETKFRKSRLVPLHETAVAALDGYLAQRHAVAGGEAHVFVATTGRPLTYRMVNGTFHFLLRSVELRATPGDRAPVPRMHDLRHRFAVHALERAAGERDRIAPHVLALSTYLGHAHVADTYWYLHATPHLMRHIADACEAGGTGGTP
jgi:integrase/recombinase XerD